MSFVEAPVPSLERTPRQVKIAALLAHYVTDLPKPVTPEAPSGSADISSP